MSYEEKLREIANSTSVIKHGSPIDPAWIADAEKEIGFPLPDSYKWWLKEFGDTSIAGQDMLTLAPPEFREDADIDLVYTRKLDLVAGVKPSNRLYFFLPSLEESFAFDLASYDQGEYPVIREDALGGGDQVYAQNFAEFMDKQRAEYDA
ncbi:SMI1/KNR4 family protein [Xanthomonas translucens]|uniref:SMI1/KNR4 family protein n=1 Tax=Xanthomonas campestris pv. translucens TaxID=343 RepID=UPI002714BD30|nr:SMI1/KNR4 family protein [Xanthomonas translucens]WLA07622.1 SMI1/KNR4 family protein [Xanthomonas translucens]WLA13342.1 SMI1/KNR4 family protein [Xanthomonas translucens]